LGVGVLLRGVHLQCPVDGLEEGAAEAALADQVTSERRIAGALNLVLGLDPLLKPTLDDADDWGAITRADVLFLTVDKPKRVEAEYRRALGRVKVKADRFAISAVRRNLELFESLGLLTDNVRAALGVVDGALAAAGITPAAEERPARVVLFTGHMVDRPDRAADKARFPRTPEAEEK